MPVTITETGFATGAPLTILQTRSAGFEAVLHGHQYDTEMGERFLVNTATESSLAIHVVLDWLTAPVGSL